MAARIARRDASRGLPEIDEEKRERKKMLRKELVTSGLAAVATIHAAHSVAKNIEAQKKRRKAVKEGTITQDQSSNMRAKENLKSAASIGLAALGIKGAVSEWKEVREQRKEHKEFEEKCRERHERRLRKRSQSSNHNQSMGASAASIGVNGADNSHNAGGNYYHDGNPYDTHLDFDY